MNIHAKKSLNKSQAFDRLHVHVANPITVTN